MALRCKDCAKMNLQDQDKYGRAYCSDTRRYEEQDSYTCRWFVEREEGYSTCFLTTAFCQIKGYSDDCIELNTLRAFRENYISKIPEGQALLEEYMVIGPIIASKLMTDMYRTDIVEDMGNNYIYPAIDFINNGRMEEAKETYVQMVESLKVRYGFLPNRNEKNKCKIKLMNIKRDFKF